MKRLLVVGLAVFAVLLSGCSITEESAETPAETALPASDPALEGPLRILLTNDDGWPAPGIVAVRDALVADGHDVTVVAPAGDYSGVSSSIDFVGELTVKQPEENVYTVTTTPAGSVLFGMGEVMADNPPDLIVSGSNVGSNTGFGQNFSGTIGAAIVGSGSFSIPAIAISTHTNYGAEEEGAYAETAAFLVELLAAGVPALERGEVLNVNFPLLEEGDADPEVRLAATAPQTPATFSYQAIDDETYQIVPGRAEEAAESGSDSDLLDQGFITITLLSADRTVEDARHAVLEPLVEQLS